MTAKFTSKNRSSRRFRWLEKFLAIIGLINLILVCFDLSYIPWRDFYWQTIPSLTQLYDPVKGIKPHPETENYLERIEALEMQVVATGLQSPQVETHLAQLRMLSIQIIEDNPFAVANKSSTLEKIKDELRQQTGESSARDAFHNFWDRTYLESNSWQQEITFWQTQIRPLFATNYYRDINRFGKFIDYFWLVDLPFIIIFALDLIIRISAIKSRRSNLSWIDAALRRWYDIFLLLPFWRWLRVIPVSIRLSHVGLLNLEPVQAEAQRDFVIGFAAELTEMVGIQVIDQLQASIMRGDIIDWLFHPENRQPYVQVNGRNEVKAIATRLINISVYDVLPQIQTDIEDLVHHSINSTLDRLPAYQKIQHLPGLNHFPQRLTENIAKSLSHIAYHNLINTIEDPVAAEITNRLSHNFRLGLEKELQKKHNVEEIQTLIVDFLEEIKINYVRGIEEIGIEKLMDEAEELHYKIGNYAKIRPRSLSS